jgi:hypothetical protein
VIATTISERERELYERAKASYDAEEIKRRKETGDRTIDLEQAVEK